MKKLPLFIHNQRIVAGIAFGLVLFGLVLIMGCSESLLPQAGVSSQKTEYYRSDNAPTPLAESIAPASDDFSGGSRIALYADGSEVERSRSQPSGSSSGPVAVIPSRKVIQNHHLDVAVKDLNFAEESLVSMVSLSGGYISRSDIGQNTGARRQGSWTLRVPGAKASDIAKQILGLGEPIKQSSDAKDVSEEYYDLEARIKNKKIEEDRLILHLKDSTGKLVDILACEKEITRVRGEIEQAQGRINMLANLSSLATIQVTLVEHKDYKPPAAPTFLTKVQRALDSSLEELLKTGQWLVLGVVSWAPWVIAWGVILLGIRFLWKAWNSIKSKGK